MRDVRVRPVTIWGREDPLLGSLSPIDPRFGHLSPGPNGSACVVEAAQRQRVVASSEVLPDSHRVALQWLDEGRRVVAATLVETVGSAPLDPGAEMLVDDSGRIEGSVTGGCVEGALVEEAQGVLAGAPPRVATYGISDQQAADVGLMCGGTREDLRARAGR